MAHNLIEVAQFISPVIVPDDGDGLRAGSMEAPLQVLTDRTEFLQTQSVLSVFAAGSPIVAPSLLEILDTGAGTVAYSVAMVATVINPLLNDLVLVSGSFSYGDPIVGPPDFVFVADVTTPRVITGWHHDVSAGVAEGDITFNTNFMINAAQAGAPFDVGIGIVAPGVGSTAGIFQPANISATIWRP